MKDRELVGDEPAMDRRRLLELLGITRGLVEAATEADLGGELAGMAPISTARACSPSTPSLYDRRGLRASPDIPEDPGEEPCEPCDDASDAEGTYSILP